MSLPRARLLSHRRAGMADKSHITWRLRTFSLESNRPHFHLIFVAVNCLCRFLWRNVPSLDLQLSSHSPFEHSTLTFNRRLAHSSCGVPFSE